MSFNSQIPTSNSNGASENTPEDTEHRRLETPPRSLQPVSSFSRNLLFRPQEVVLRPATPDIDTQDAAPSFSDTQSNIRASSVELSGMRIENSPLKPLSHPSGPSALSILISESRVASRERATESELNERQREPVQEREEGRDCDRAREIDRGRLMPSESNVRIPSIIPNGDDNLPLPATESTPLISKRRKGLISSLGYLVNAKRPHIFTRELPSYHTIVRAIPAVILGLLINILDGVSYGMIVFPTTGIFSDFGGTGVSMFFVTTIIAQLVYTFGGSRFAGANGSMMIEVVPFFHILASTIEREIGGSDPKAVIATTMVAFALSSILTGLYIHVSAYIILTISGLVFLVLGFLNLGVLIGFFPRHILVGCIGGIGIFLIETGFEVAVGIKGGFDYTPRTFALLFEPRNFVLWAPALGLALGLRLITTRWNHQLVFPLYFLSIPVVFYMVVAIAKLSITELRQAGWLFDMGSTTEPWYHFYSYFDFQKTNYRILWQTIPTQLALLFFNILHPPLNVPALAVSLDQDVDTNKELIGHGYSNLFAGLTGSVYVLSKVHILKLIPSESTRPNYLVYVNTLLFYRVGGDTRFASFMLAVGTALLLLVGTGPIGYIRMDLVREALWDTWRRASIKARSIRAVYTGDSALSAVRRPGAQREYIREVARQTLIMKLQGHLFFGTINRVETEIRGLLEPSTWLNHPIRFLILDLSLVAGVDLSSAEAFVRIQRLLSGRRTILVFCGFSPDSEIGEALKNVDLFREDGVELFSNLNEALEWTENAYLKAWFASNKIKAVRDQQLVFSGRRNSPSEQLIDFLDHSSPRRSQLRDAGGRILEQEILTPVVDALSEGLFETLVKVFSSFGPIDPTLYRPLTPYFNRITAPEGEILWKQGEPSDALYLIEKGVLRASYSFFTTGAIEESMVAGTVAGELSAISGTTRNATVVVERDAVLWRLSTDDLRRMETEKPDLARAFIRLILKCGFFTSKDFH
ncbi:hypothetical protein Clacol_008515 [Clathrus columnatus]|uniref:Uncharacterized protein n=1 Tax=Clathrus columnatus TaxID=1419009 RepID=A0AAV5AHY7_9AGAM|nr:hypothetical protein Clacol_008515 [Clathrus columnatus]